MMEIRKMDDLTADPAWIDGFAEDPCFSTPFCGRDRIRALAEKKENLLLGAYEGEKLIGFFCLLALEEEKYLETLFLAAREKRAYDALWAYLRKTRLGHELWVVCNPKNPVLMGFLTEKQAFFYPEQRTMEAPEEETEDPDGVIPYDGRYREEYLRIHSRDGYWDGEKVLEQKDAFHIFLCIREGRLAGYLDVSNESGTNEIMDLRVLPECRNRGIGGLLLRKALFVNRGHRLILTVDTDNGPANHLYEKLGFREIPGERAITAKMTL